MDIRDVIHSEGFESFEGQVLRFGEGCGERTVCVTDSRKLTVEVAPGAEGRLVLLHASPIEVSLCMELGEGASLSVTQLFTAEAFVEVEVRQAAGSKCDFMMAQLASANVSYRFALDGRDAECSLNGVFVAGGKEHCQVVLRTEHNASDCRSQSLVKGVAGGQATGEFRGLVYVATDAQRTDARQQSRNILLSEQAHIRTKPQLEIYADDVKCSHGATVGQMDAEAVFYMRQRGLSEMQARALQIEGFVGDVVNRCAIEPLREALMGAVTEKLHTM